MMPRVATLLRFLRKRELWVMLLMCISERFARNKGHRGFWGFTGLVSRLRGDDGAAGSSCWL